MNKKPNKYSLIKPDWINERKHEDDDDGDLIELSSDSETEVVTQANKSDPIYNNDSMILTEDKAISFEATNNNITPKNSAIIEATKINEILIKENEKSIENEAIEIDKKYEKSNTITTEHEKVEDSINNVHLGLDSNRSNENRSNIEVDKASCSEDGYETDCFDDDIDEDDKISFLNKGKWCVCTNGDKTFPDSKICEKCNQWYHLKCLNYTDQQINALNRNNKIEGFECPVCKCDSEFIEKYSVQILDRKNRFQMATNYASSETDSDVLESINLKKSLDVKKPVNTLINKNLKIAQSKQSSASPKTKKTILLSREEPLKKPKKTALTEEKEISSEKKTASYPAKTLPKLTIESIPISTADMTCQPIVNRKNLNCIYCKNVLKDKNHPTPKALATKFFKESKDLAKNWFDSIYCDEECIKDYIDLHVTCKEDLKQIELLDSITKRRKYQIINDKSLDLFKEKIYSFIAKNPKYFIIDKAYIRKFSSSLANIELQKGSPALIAKTINTKPEFLSNQTNKIQIRKTQPIQVKCVSNQAAPSSQAPISPISPKVTFSNKLESHRSNFIELLKKHLKARHESTTIKMQLENKIENVNIDKLVTVIELEVYKFFSNDPKKYSIRSRSIIANISTKANNTFYLKVLNGKLAPSQLPRMEVSEMADDRVSEQRAKDQQFDIEQRIKYSDECNIEKSKPRIKLTHKGELYAGEDMFFTTPLYENKTETKMVDEEVPKRLSEQTVSVIAEDFSTNQVNLLTDISEPSAPSPLICTAIEAASEDSNQMSEAFSPISPLIDPEPVKSLSPTLNLNKRKLEYESASTETTATDKSVFKKSTTITQASPSPPPPPPLKLIELKENTNLSNKTISELRKKYEILKNKTDGNRSKMSNDNLKLEKSFWQGGVETHDKSVISMHASSIAVAKSACQTEMGAKLNQIGFASNLEFVQEHPISSKWSGSTFWNYIDLLRNNHSAKLAFFSLNSSHTKNGSKMLLPNKTILMDDDDMYARFFEYISDKAKVFEYKVPMNLQTTIGYIYVTSLKKKPESTSHDLTLEKKYSILLPRNKNQLIGICIDVETKTKYNLPSNFNMFQSNRNESVSQIEIIGSKRKSTELSEELEMKKSKITFTVKTPLEANNPKVILKKPENASVINTKDPRLLKELRDPRQTPDSPSHTDSSDNSSIDEQISNFSIYINKMNPNEATEWVDKFMSSNTLNEEQKRLIFEKLENYYKDMTKNTLVLDKNENYLITPNTTEEREKRSRFANEPSPSSPITNKQTEESENLVNMEAIQKIIPLEDLTEPAQSYLEESAFSIIDQTLSKLNPTNQATSETLKALEGIVKKKHGSLFQLTASQTTQLNHKYGNLFPEFLSFIGAFIGDQHIKSTNKTKLITEIGGELPPAEKWQGESKEAFEELQRLHAIQNERKLFSNWDFQNKNWNLDEKAFKILKSPYPEEEE